MIAEEMKFLAIAAIRDSVTAGLEKAVTETINDSSNAATHWQVGITNASGGSRRPASTKLGKGPLDFRPRKRGGSPKAVSYTHLRAHETPEHLVCRLLL